jgi:subtilisin family serine protease
MRMLPWLVILLLGCPSTPPDVVGDDDDSTPWPDPFEDYVPDPDVFALDFDVAGAIDVLDSQAPADQLIVVLDEGAEIEPVLTALNGTVVGQIPALRAHQLTIPSTDAATLLSALDTATALPGVAGAAFNAIGTWEATPEYCLMDDDNSQNLEGPSRCGLSDPGYYQASRILQELAQHMVLSPVKVAVVDTGLQLDFGQFDDVFVLDLEQPNREPIDNHGHGTRVSGVIAADDGDGSTNGIASAVLGRHLSLEVGGFHEDVWRRLVGVARAAFEGEADVINMSFGKRYTAAEAKIQATIMGLYTEIAELRPNTLFVTAAGNVNEQLTLTNNTPAGLQAPNFLSVGGTPHCEPTERWIHTDPVYGSTWGPLIDISAPAHQVPLLPYDPTRAIYDPGGTPILGNGTSYASPMVVAVAAILRSFDSDLTAAQIKTYLLEEASLTDESLNWRRLVITRPVVQMLVDRGAPAAVQDLINADEDPARADIGGLILNRICDGADLTVSGRGSWNFVVDEDVGAGFINDMGFSISLGQEDSEPGFFMTRYESDFELDRDYSIPGEMEAGFYQASTGYGANGVAGSVAFDGCAVTERNDLDQSILLLQVAGTGNGTLQGMEPPNPAIIENSFDTRFNVPLVVYPGTSTSDVFEQICEGGLM